MSSPPRLLCLVSLLGALVIGAACAGRSPSVADAGPPGPSLAFVGLGGTVGCDADADAEQDGFQLEVGVELVDDDGSGFAQVSLANSRNNASASGSLAEGPATLTIEVVPAAAPGAENTLTAVADNGEGQTLEVSTVVVVECEIPPPTVSCAFTSPADGSVVAADHVEVALACSSSGLNAAQRAWLGSAQVRVDVTPAAGGSTLSRELDLVEGSARGNVAFPATGDHTLVATVLDPDGLLDPDPSATLSVDVQP